MSIVKHLAGLVVAALLLCLPTVVSADATATDFVRGKQDSLRALLKQEQNEKRDGSISGVFDAMLDYNALAQHSLGDHWSERSEQERQEFQAVLKQLVQRAYRKNLDKTVDYKVAYSGEQPGEHGTIVQTVATKAGGSRDEPVRIDYVVHKVDGKWRVIDIVTEGSSLTRNYRRQFSRIIKKKGFDELMRKMKAKLNE